MKPSSRLSTAFVVSLASLSPVRARAQVWEVGNVLLKSTSAVESGQFGAAVAAGDLDGDGHWDLVVGAPGFGTDDGSVWFFHGGGAARTFTFWGEVVGASGEGIGLALATGDFDHDGKDELAMGAPGAGVSFDGNTITRAGRVVIWKRDTQCGCFKAVQSLSQIDTPGFTNPETGDEFGSVLAVGDFNGDDFDDLAVGVPHEGVGSSGEQGIAQVFYGGASGLRTDDAAGFRAGANGVLGSPGSFNEMGAALATRDFDADGHADLAIGAPKRDVLGFDEAGQVHVLRGSVSGLTTAGQQLLSEADLGGTLGEHKLFGAALSAADFNGSVVTCLFAACYADLAIGVPNQTVNGQESAGKVMISHGGSSGISNSGVTVLTQDGNGDVPEADDRFGEVLAAGALDGNADFFSRSASDLAVGVPHEALSAGANAGFVHLLQGAGTGATQSFGEKKGFKIAPAEASDLWGQALAIADLDGDGWGDLVAGAPGKTVNGVTAAGSVDVLFGALFADGFERGTTGNWDGAAP